MAPSRSQARWLAPLALVACAVAVYAVARSGGSHNDGSPARTSTTSHKVDAGGQTTPSTTPASAIPRRYTIKDGDTLSAIALTTGVPLDTILRLNPGLDSQTLQAGQTVKLAP